MYLQFASLVCNICFCSQSLLNCDGIANVNFITRSVSLKHFEWISFVNVSQFSPSTAFQCETLKSEVIIDFGSALCSDVSQFLHGDCTKVKQLMLCAKDTSTATPTISTTVFPFKTRRWPPMPATLAPLPQNETETNNTDPSPSPTTTSTESSSTASTSASSTTAWELITDESEWGFNVKFGLGLAAGFTALCTACVCYKRRKRRVTVSNNSRVSYRRRPLHQADPTHFEEEVSASSAVTLNAPGNELFSLQSEEESGDSIQMCENPFAYPSRNKRKLK